MKIEQKITQLDEPGNPVRISYTFGESTSDEGLSKTVRTLSINAYSSQKAELRVGVKDATTAAQVQAALTASGMHADINSTGSGAKTVTVKSTNAGEAMITAALALAGLGSKAGSISTQTANAIVDQELKRTEKKPSELKFLSSKIVSFDERSHAKKGPNAYVDIDVTYPLSPITYLRESSLPASTGETSTTRIGAKDKSTAERMKALFTAEGKATSELIQDDGNNGVSLHVKAPMTQTVKALRLNGLMLPTIAEEIGEIVAKARPVNNAAKQESTRPRR